MKLNLLPCMFFFLSTFFVDKTSAQLLYSNTTFSGFVQNPGFVGSTPTIILDDVQIDPSGLPTYDSIDITMIKAGIARFAGAPAVTIKLYYSNASDTSTSLKTSPAIPPIFVDSIDLPAATVQSIVTVTFGDGINTLFTIPKKTDIPYSGKQTFFVGLSFSDADANNGWATATATSTNDDIYWSYNAARSSGKIDSAWFSGSPAATFNLEVYGTTRVLPLSFLNFNGVMKNSIALLTWTTSNEINNKGFNIQKSYDGGVFDNIGFVAAKSVGALQNNYSYSDSRVKNGNIYYRLQQVDQDGKTSYSGILNIKNDGALSWRIYPNPLESEAWMQLQLPKKSNVIIQIISQSGQVLLLCNKGLLTEGNYSIPLNISNSPKGVYLVKLIVDDKIFEQKILK